MTKKKAMTTRTEPWMLHDPSASGSLLVVVLNIFDEWHLEGTQKMTLLGISSEKACHNWKSHPEKFEWTQDLLERASCILRIYKSLQILFPDRMLANRWLFTPNDNPLFNGRIPLEWLLAGQAENLMAVSNFLEAEWHGR